MSVLCRVRAAICAAGLLAASIGLAVGPAGAVQPDEMLKDPAPVVRIAAAHAMCDWGADKEGLAVLVESLKYKGNKAGLHAVIALNRIGEKARPALPQIRECLNNSDNYVKRVTQSVLKSLGNM